MRCEHIDSLITSLQTSDPVQLEVIKNKIAKFELRILQIHPQRAL
jgi:hypothetical protein